MSEGPLPRIGAFDNIMEPRTLPTCGVVPYLGWFMTMARASHWTDTLNVINSAVSLTPWICIGERACVPMTTCDHPDASLVADIGHDGECSVSMDGRGITGIDATMFVSSRESRLVAHTERVRQGIGRCKGGKRRPSSSMLICHLCPLSLRSCYELSSPLFVG